MTVTYQATPSRAAQPRRWRPTSPTRLIPMIALVLAALMHFAGPARATALDKAMDAVLVVYSDDLDEAFLGSAFLWGDGQLAVTNQHVVGDATTVELRTRDGQRLSARVVARDKGRDIALIAVPDAVLGKGLLPADYLPDVGEPVFALGAPLGAEFTATQGMISATGRQIEEAMPIRYVQHDAAVNPGSSGGPLVDAEGRLVGMNSQIADGSRLFAGIAYAMSSVDIERLVPVLADGSLKPVPDLGLRLRPVSRKIAAALGIEAERGLLIDAVKPGSIADRGGLEPGDVILAFGAGVLHAPGDLAFRIEARIGDFPELTVLRQGFRVRVVLDLKPTGSILAKMSAGAAPGKVASYSFAGLGIACGSDGRVTGLNPASPAGFAGLVEGDIILTINGKPVAEVDLATLEVTGPLVLLIERREGETLHVIVDPWGKGRGARPVGGANVLDPAVVLF
ncbi:trypsin-like peptidase domain-containing protein [Frigidibacter sp. ROC022]|uniref:trypsin-like peptidase domain-containing protein n=1 Tax=Frigidibacter sp. ROC022 TaxID=2971796 RepID=UPI00215B626F|nr:trypsin-like peptidase domain-containing protein [Frigidibacter sp. ROC022]MCR8724196.1 trypsin-like peptidase domain-containing protein [Frigidibacter sp. ROC022]